MPAGSRALLGALLSGDSAAAIGLLESSDTVVMSHVGPHNFTAVHAAVVGGCSDALPALAAAGAPLDAAVDGRSGASELDDFLEDFGLPIGEQTMSVVPRLSSTALYMAVR
jgi:hypothetical protein